MVDRSPRVPAHQIATRNLGAAYPFIAEAGLGRRGVVIGDDLLGGSFVFDPFELYAQGVISNPNMVVFGQIGRGKSAFVKTFLWRQAVFGRRAWVVDPKGEYGDLAAAWGVRPVALRPGGAIRLNPLDPGPEHEGGVVDGEGSTARRQMELLTSLASACLGRSLLPRERAALGVALVSATEQAAVPTVPSVVEALLAPTAESAASLRTELRELLEDGRDVALELRRLVHGDLAGMFDGPTTTGLDLSAPLVVLDLSALYTSAALGILMACATAWLQAALARTSSAGGGSARTSGQVFLVVDESWAILSNLVTEGMATEDGPRLSGRSGRVGSMQSALTAPALVLPRKKLPLANPPQPHYGDTERASSIVTLRDRRAPNREPCSDANSSADGRPPSPQRTRRKSRSSQIGPFGRGSVS